MDDADPGAEEQGADLTAFERTYEDDFSWEHLREDAEGNLVAV
ncbi:hypothetical protein H632_c4521p0, partial [Helicosporidium sp. ATCC 50920]